MIWSMCLPIIMFNCRDLDSLLLSWCMKKYQELLFPILLQLHEWKQDMWMLLLLGQIVLHQTVLWVTMKISYSLLEHKNYNQICLPLYDIAGDTANKIGTYSVTLSAKFHNVPFYVAAPLTSIDLSLSSGQEIVIEERSPRNCWTHMEDLESRLLPQERLEPSFWCYSC